MNEEIYLFIFFLSIVLNSSHMFKISLKHYFYNSLVLSCRSKGDFVYLKNGRKLFDRFFIFDSLLSFIDNMHLFDNFFQFYF